MKRENVIEFFTRLRALNPNPTTELEYSSPFELLIAVILSAQSTDKAVNRATGPLFKVANTAKRIRALGLAGLIPYIQTIGLFNAKAKNIISTVTIIDEQYGGEIPRTRVELEALPGVGRKTANVVLNTAYGVPVIAVDTHLFRVANRTGLAAGKTVRAVEDRLVKVIPAEFAQDAHHWLILHGRYLCKARSPECWRCPVREVCAWRSKTKDPQSVPLKLAQTPRAAAKPASKKAKTSRRA